MVKPASVSDAAVPDAVAHDAGSVIVTTCELTEPVVAVVQPVPVKPVPNVMAGEVGILIPAPKVTVTVPAAGTAVPVKPAVQVTEVAPAVVELGVTDTEVNPANTIAVEPEVAAVVSVLVATVKPVGPYEPATGFVNPASVKEAGVVAASVQPDGNVTVTV